MQLDTLTSSRLGSNGMSVAVLLVFALCVLAWLSIRLTRGHDPREPPCIQPTIPFIGHLVGMVKYGAKYFEYVK
jgi:hypothetical protein